MASRPIACRNRSAVCAGARPADRGHPATAPGSRDAPVSSRCGRRWSLKCASAGKWFPAAAAALLSGESPAHRGPWRESGSDTGAWSTLWARQDLRSTSGHLYHSSFAAVLPALCVTGDRRLVPRLPLTANALDIAALAQGRQWILRQIPPASPGTHQRLHIEPEGLAQALLRVHKPALVLQISQLLAIDQRCPGKNLLRRDDCLYRCFHLALQIVALVDHERSAVHSLRVAENFMEDAEDLVGIDRAERQVIIGVTAVVEVEAAQLLLPQQPRNNLLDVLTRVVMPRIHQDNCLLAHMPAHGQRHAPVRQIRVVEGRFERLILQQHALVLAQTCMHGAQDLLHPVDPAADALRPGVVRSIGQPDGQIARLQNLRNLNRVQQVLQRDAADRRVRVADRSVLVLLVLEQIRIDGTGAHAVLRLEGANVLGIANAAGEIPQHMQGQRWRYAGERIYLGGSSIRNESSALNTRSCWLLMAGSPNVK